MAPAPTPLGIAVAAGKAPRIAVVIATLGRPQETGQLLACLARQTFPPSTVILSVTTGEDVPRDIPAWTRVVVGSKGSSAQRNRGLNSILQHVDLIAFFDDDYLPSIYALERIAVFFARHPDVAGANGILLADGINSPGIAFEQAAALVAEYDRAPAPAGTILKDLSGLYGCNMVYRAASIGEVRFDEALPLYGWQEDIDFAARVGRMARIVKTDAFAGVHRGVKGSRTSGVRFGYSQVVNPLYLVHKGTMDVRFAVRLVARNLVANHVRALIHPEPWLDRRGRLKGNWWAIQDIVRRRAHPKQILDMT